MPVPVPSVRWGTLSLRRWRSVSVTRTNTDRLAGPVTSTSRPRWSVADDGTLTLNVEASSVSRLTSASAFAAAASALALPAVSVVIWAWSGAIRPAASDDGASMTVSAGTNVPPSPAHADARSVVAVSVTPVAALTLSIHVAGSSPMPADVAWNGM